LIGQLQHQGVAFVIFDLYFNDSQPDIDPTLAKAMRSANNVLAVDCVQTAVNSWTECGNKPGPINQSNNTNVVTVKVNPPTPELAQALLDHAPFFLSSDPANPHIRQGWTFVDEHAELPTLPVLVWFHYLERNGSLQNFSAPSQPLSAWLSKQRRNCVSHISDPINEHLIPFVVSLSNHERNQPLTVHPEIGEGLNQESLNNSANKTNLANRIDEVICQDHSRYFDFYGPPKTIRTVSYSDVVTGKVNDLAGKIVFVGQTSRRQGDSFLTPFTDSSSGRMVGVEVMATQFGNLLEGRVIAAPIAPAVVMFLFGLITCVLLTQLPGFLGIAVSLLFSGVYLAMALWCFNRNGLWLPVVVPLLLQLPLASFISLYWSRLDQLQVEKRLKATIAQITEENNRLINQFIDQLETTKSLKLTLQGKGFPETVNGICLATDIEGFTDLAERIQPNELFAILRKYFRILGTVVSSYGGKIANIAGDGMIAIWVEQYGIQQNNEACLATLQMRKEIDRFNAVPIENALLTRFGLHEGEFYLGNLARDLHEDNPIGDAINTASRIQGVNKVLGTKILASSAIVTNLSAILSRPVGSFLLSGKHEPIDLIEVIGTQAELDESRLKLYKDFDKGLTAFRLGHWKQALAHFKKLQDKHGADGPTKYYVEKFADQEYPPPDWEGYITLKKM
jgi:adenylate cyclase